MQAYFRFNLSISKIITTTNRKNKKIEKRKKNISFSANKKNNINKAFNEYATDFTNNNYNEDDILLEVGAQQITQNKESEYYQSRLNDVQAIEKTMEEISQMMNKLSQMTYEQNFMI